MRTAFVIGILLGIGAVLAAAKYMPWVAPTRIPSLTTVVANGGRAEEFVIRLPADRITQHGGRDAGLRAAAFPPVTALPESLRSEPLVVEQFKVRDREGRVIGVAARHWTQGGGASGTAWLVVIPGRGALLLRSEGEPARAVDAELAAAGFRSGESWSGEIRVSAADEAEPGTIRGGAAEFAGLEGRYTETWTVTGVGAGGELKGTIELRTVIFARS
jgi:hypothetical protein